LVFRCNICGVQHDDIPDSFGIEPPWRAFVAEDEFEARVTLSADQCVIDDNVFFIRGLIEIPIHGHHNSLTFSVWSSLSEKSFSHITDRWEASDRDQDDPYFGWLCSPIWVYPDTIHLKLSVQSRSPGLAPTFKVLNEGHPLTMDQCDGISLERWHQLALQLSE
jgi:hypothetical protein